MSIISLVFIFFGLYILFINKLFIYEWIIYNLDSIKINLIVVIRFKLLIFIFLVILICSIILLYRVSYINLNNKYLIKRFYYLIILFLLSIIFLILRPNILTLLLGWDGLGLISYCLIIYYQKNLAFNSGILTVILNRLGDSRLLIIISFIIIFGRWNLILYNINLLILIIFLIIVFRKSAQLIFIIWLPAAIIAPTPVSSLVHSSTLVTAGIYLLINYEILIDLKYKEYILVISRITIFISGVIANFEIDFKKIIALSTLSQLGFIIRIYSLGIVNLTFLHLFIHAFFKSIIFICVGSLIHYIRGIQNFRFYSGIYYLYPIKGLLIIFSLIILCGFPFLVGFYSKDLIVEYYFLNKIRIFRLLNLIIGTIFTVSYSFRLIFILIINSFIINLIYSDEDNIIMNYIILILLIILFIRKFVFNFFFFHIRVNLFYIFKYFVFKIMFLGFIFSLLIFNTNFLSKVILLIKSFFIIDFFYKFILNYLIYWLIFYEIYFEKGIIEKFTGKFIDFFRYLFEINYRLKIFYILLMYIYLLILILLFN